MLCQQILGLSAVVSIWLITSFDKRHHSQQLSAFGNTLPYPLISNCQHLRWPPSQMTWYVKSPLSGVNVKKCERILYHPLPLRNGKLLLLSRFPPFGFFSRAAILGSHLSFCPPLKSAAIFTDQNHIFADKKPFFGFTRFVNKKLSFSPSLFSSVIYFFYKLLFTCIQQFCLQNSLHFYILELHRHFGVIYQKCFILSVYV